MNLRQNRPQQETIWCWKIYTPQCVAGSVLAFFPPPKRRKLISIQIYTFIINTPSTVIFGVGEISIIKSAPGIHSILTDSEIRNCESYVMSYEAFILFILMVKINMKHTHTHTEITKTKCESQNQTTNYNIHLLVLFCSYLHTFIPSFRHSFSIKSHKDEQSMRPEQNKNDQKQIFFLILCLPNASQKEKRKMSTPVEICVFSKWHRCV